MANKIFTESVDYTALLLMIGQNFNVKKFGAVGDGVTDDTAAVNAAISAAFNAGGGVIFFPDGIYLLNGAFNPSSNSVLVIPQNATTGQPITIKFMGAFVSRTSENPPPDKGVIWKRTVNTASGAYPSLIAARAYSDTSTSLAEFNYVSMEFENIYGRVPNDPQFSFINAHNAIGCQIRNVQATPDASFQNVLEPTRADSHCVILPGLNNHAQILVENLSEYGFYNGIRFSEHATFQGLVAIAKNKNALIAEKSYRPGRGAVTIEQCARSLSFEGVSTVDLLLNLEHNTSALWHGSNAPGSFDIYDPNNYGHGSLRYKVTTGYVGDNTDAATRSGGNNLQYNNLFLPTAAPAPVLTGSPNTNNVNDNFSGTDNATLAGRVPNVANNNAAYGVTAGTWVVNNNQAQSAGGAVESIFTLDSARTSPTIEFKFISSAGSLTVYPRYQGADNFIYAFYDSGTAQIGYGRCVGGTYTTVGFVGNQTLVSGDVFKVVQNGGTMSIFKNGTQLLTNATFTDFPAATIVGVRSYNTAIIDDFKVITS